MRIITAHLDEVGESYAEHFRHAAYYGVRMTGAGLACLLHAAIPGLCKTTGSRCIWTLYHKMTNRGRVPPAYEADLLEYQI